MQDRDDRPQGQPKNPPPRKRWLRLALVASLAVNLLLIGLLAGGALRAWQAPVQPSMAEIRALWQVLPADTRQALRREFRGQHRRGDGAGQAGRAGEAGAEMALSTHLRGDPFDADAFIATLDDARTRRGERARQAEQALARHIAALTAAERAALADALEERLANRAPRQRRGMNRSE